MKHLNIIITIFIVQSALAGEISTYLQQYAKTQKRDHSSEMELVEKTKLNKLIKELTPFYTDTLDYIRQKAYYLTYKKGLMATPPEAAIAIRKLIGGCSDKKAGIAGQNIDYLKQFNREYFDIDAIAGISALLGNKKQAHHKELILLAGYIGAGKDILLQKYLAQDTPEETRFYAACALARMGEKEQLAYCLGLIEKQAINNKTVAYLIPFAIYMRQMEAVDYCIKIINSDEKRCSSPNPDYSGDILCGYRVLELVAPVIDDFPVKIDQTGSIHETSYEEALKAARSWFSEHQDYTINNTAY